MTRIESGVVARLPYALTDSQCSNWGMQLEWDCVFDNVSLPKYAAKHCGYLYFINIETVKFDVIIEKIQHKKKYHRAKGLVQYLWQRERKQQQQEPASEEIRKTKLKDQNGESRSTIT
jgi:hypothetical protein